MKNEIFDSMLSRYVLTTEQQNASLQPTSSK